VLFTFEILTSTHITFAKVKLLLKKHRRAVQGVSDTQGPYEELTKSLDLANVQKWKKAAEQAAHERGSLLDIYQLKMDKGRSVNVNFNSALTVTYASSNHG
jgi:hypothetical protein